jgi:indole-3-glycerol phosphate synthase
LLPLVPPSVLVISESGVKSQADVRRLVAQGARGVLVGESLMRAEDKHEAIRSLKGAAVPA